jgi:hypothetical protein
MADPKIDLWSTDEVHFQQYGSRCLMWVPPEEKDPVLLHHPTRKSVGYFGAVRLRDGKLVFQREEERFNAVTTPNTITQGSTLIGETSKLLNSYWIFCLLTALSSIPLSGYGN